MRNRRPSAEHQEAVSRRLAMLGAELEAARPEPTADGVEWWAAHTRVPGARPVLSVVDDPAVDPVEAPQRGRTSWEPVPGEPVKGGPAPWDDVAGEEDQAPLVPVPGRHSARRPARVTPQVLAASVPETLRGRVALGPGQVAVLAVLVAVGLAVTCWWVVRGDAETGTPAVTAPAGDLVAVPAVPSAAQAPAAASSGAPATGGTGAVSGTEVAGVAPGAVAAANAGTVTVDVAGKVRRPGIAVLEPGARVVDALEAAGGARAGVDLTSLNLARVLVDGEQILVGQAAPVGAAAVAVPTGGASASGVAGAPSALVNLNTATEAELDTLPDVGPVTAQSILAWRDEHGGFTSVDELLEVSGIGDATLARVAPYVTL